MIDTSSVVYIAQAVVTGEGQRYDEVAIFFIDDISMRRMHGDYFGDSSSTDCISFPVQDPDSCQYRLLGDVFVCPAAAASYVADHGGDVYQEVTLYVVHGLLHLLGYGDQEEAACLAMRRAESSYMDRLSGRLVSPEAS